MVSWQNVLQRAEAGNHIVQVYNDTAFLVNGVALFLNQGLQNGDALVVITTPAHEAAFIQRLKDEGHDLAALRDQDRVIFVNAEDLLQRLLGEGTPDPQVFTTLVGALLERARGQSSRAVRVYGEMVNILFHQRRRAAAFELETLWNDLHQQQPFSLFCAYELDLFSSEAYDGTLQSICKMHSHFIPAENYEKLGASVSWALDVTIGRPLAETLRSLGSASDFSTKMPEAQSQLLWLRQNLPEVGDKVLALVRQQYQSPTFNTPAV